jgi:glucose-fructose oxidoreductase
VKKNGDARGRGGAKPQVRYAVVGLGHIAQVAVLPAFAHARANSKLAAVVSGDEKKRRSVGRRYGVPAFDYTQYGELLESLEIDAVYLALPNHLHCEYAVRAAEAGVHVLCEKPMAVTEEECQRMLAAARRTDTRLMIAYRLHFDPANLGALSLVRSGRLGEPRVFESTFTMQVKPGNVRLHGKGGGPLYDVGVYCINAARNLFGAEPRFVLAHAAKSADPRFHDVEEALSAILSFPGERIAAFTCSFGAADVSSYRVIGTRADLRVEPAYEYHEPLAWTLTRNGRATRRRFAPSDQFAPELLYFSRCVLDGLEPEPSGIEGMLDVRIVRALLHSAASGRGVNLPAAPRDPRPTARQAHSLPPVRKPRLVRATSASI